MEPASTTEATQSSTKTTKFSSASLAAKCVSPATSTLISPSASRQEKDTPSLEAQSGNAIQAAEHAEAHQPQSAHNVFQAMLYQADPVSPATTPTLSLVHLTTQATL